MRGETLDILLSLIEDEYQPGRAILDIGFGSGMVEELIFQRIPGAYVVGVDGSEPMIEIARRRLAPYENQMMMVMHDITQVGTMQLPPAEYQIAISVQTLSNVANEDKKAIFKFAHGLLDEGGLFIVLDRMGIDTPALYSCYKTVWNRLNRIHNARINEGATFEEHLKKMEDAGALTANPEQHLQWLREAGFGEAACLYLHGHRALIVGRKGTRET